MVDAQLRAAAQDAVAIAAIAVFCARVASHCARPIELTGGGEDVVVIAVDGIQDAGLTRATIELATALVSDRRGYLTTLAIGFAGVAIAAVGGVGAQRGAHLV